MSLSDRRLHPRFPFHSRATMSTESWECVGTLLDLSLSGALFAGDDQIRPGIGDRCKLKVFNGARQALTVEGELVHIHRALVGVKFALEDLDVAEAVRRIVHMNLGTDRLLFREVAALLR